MIALWMSYATVLAALLGMAAHAGEWALRSSGRAGRWTWLAATVGSLAVPLWALASGAEHDWTAAARAAAQAPGPAGADGVAGLAGLAAPLLARWTATLSELAAPGGALDLLDLPLLAAWAAASAALAVVFAGASLRLRRRVRSWVSGSGAWPPHRPLPGARVAVAGAFGPALVGLSRPTIVLPLWLLELGDEAVRLVLLHEEEHRRARDTWLLHAGVLAVLLTPWNVMLWWHLRRLRHAVEADCDARVLRRGTSPRAYGAVLVEVAARAGRALAWAAPLVERPAFLERRIQMIARRGQPKGRSGAALAAAAGAALLAIACEAPAPTALQPPPIEPFEALAPAGGVPAILDTAPGSQRNGAGTRLVFVDGGIFEGDLADLDPDEVDRIELIRPPRSEQLHGPRARTGAVRIYLKKPGTPTP